MQHNNYALIKPASSLCNLNCKYCFYKDVAENRDVYAHKFMNTDVLSSIVNQYCSNAIESTTFLFQGGEPLLVGHKFYLHYLDECARVLDLKQNEGSNFTINSSIQTSGYLIDDKFIDIFKKGDFLVGVSIDGPAQFHDKYRLHSGKGTFDRVFERVRMMQESKVIFNALCVVTKDTYDKASELLDFFVENKIYNIQFIPAIAPFKKNRIYINDDEFSIFFLDIFDAWYKYYKQGCIISIRHIEDMFSNILYSSCRSCDLQGQCSNQNVIESDGSIYPCDFYVLDEYKIGTVQNGIVNLNKSIIDNFIDSKVKHDECDTCNVYKICRGGCRRNRGENNRSFLCKSFKKLISCRYPQIAEVAKSIR